MHGLRKLYKKFILAWNEWAWINGLLKVFVSQCSLAYWGSPERAGSDHMSSFQAFVWVYLCGNCISCGHCVSRLTSPYIHCQAIAGPATETNWYIQAPAPFGSHDTFQTNKKKNILACWKSWGKIGHYGDQAAGPPRPIKLQSDVNFCYEGHSPLHTSDTN